MDNKLNEIEYSLVIPCYNESKNLKALFESCLYLLKENNNIEIILVDNGSTDDTDIVISKLLHDSHNERLRTNKVAKNQGYGFGIVSGLQVSVGRIVGWMHADLQTDPACFSEVIKIFKKEEGDKNKIFVKGKRYGRSFRDVFFTWGMSFIEKLILGVYMHDINAQPTAFPREFFLSWDHPPKDFSLDLFVYHEAIKRNFSIFRFPVQFGQRLSGIGHNDTLFSKLKYSWKTILFSLGLRKHLHAVTVRK